MKNKYTSKCVECKYFENINGVRTCRKQKTILDEKIAGCLSGEK